MAPTSETIARTLEQFVRSEFRIPDADQRFHGGAHLYDLGFVDSAGFAELVVFIESRFELELLDEDLFSDEFTTVDGISAVIHRRLNGHTPVEPDAPSDPLSQQHFD